MKTDNAIKAERDKNFQPLFVRLQERIKRIGPVSFCDWMSAALYEEPDGYYVRADKVRWGRLGDYRTASEISSLFAATFASFFEKLYEDMDQPSEFFIIEAGGGAGHFAFHVLQTLQKGRPRFFSALSYLIDEASDTSRRQSKELLESFSQKVSFCHLSEIEDPFSNAIIFSNELLDAFPVHRVVMRDGKLKEIFVGLDRGDKFALLEQSPSSSRLADYIEANEVEISEGQIIEVNLAAEDWLRQVARSIKNGFVITVDYGTESGELYDMVQRPDGSLRAFGSHKFVEDWLSRPGEVDLTSTVNWTALKRTGEENGLQRVSLEPLDKFLLRVGILDQLERIAKRSESEAEKIQLRANARDLILPTGLGATHQVLVQKKETER
jgi:SAM-dependent MidA family methyltransferase